MIDYDPERISQNINEETTSGAISYIPGGFANVKKQIRTLAKTKHDWGITVYADKEYKRVVFEDSLVINVKVNEWDTFVEEMGLTQEDGKYSIQECVESEVYEGKIDFYNILESDISEEWGKSVNKVMSTFKGLLYRKGITLFEREIDNWKTVFESIDESSCESLLSIFTLTECLNDIERIVKEEYNNDLGGLDILAYQLNGGNISTLFELMGNPKFLLSGHIESKINESLLRFEIVMDKRFRLSENVLTEGGKVILESSGVKEFIISNKLILPSRGLFGISGMQQLRKIVEGNMEEKYNG